MSNAPSQSRAYRTESPSGIDGLAPGLASNPVPGPGVRRFGVGDRVTHSFLPEWIDRPYTGKSPQYSADAEGWLADYRVAAAQALVRIPAALAFDEAATLPCAGVTAWSAMKGVRPGTRS